MDWLVKISVLLASWVVIAIGGPILFAEYQRIWPSRLVSVYAPEVKQVPMNKEMAEIFRMAGAGPGERTKVVQYCEWNRERAAKGEPVAQIVAACDRQALR